MPDPTNPQPGDEFVGKHSGDTITVHIVSDRAVVYFYDCSPNEPFVRAREDFAAHFVPVVEPWPEPPTKWAVQWQNKDGAWRTGYMTDDKDSINDELNDFIASGFRARVVPYVPQVTE